MFHELLKWIMKGQRKHEFCFINEVSRIDGNCIYAANHSCKWDFQYMVEIAPKPFVILAGKQRLGFIDRIGFIWNGTVWVDRKDRKNKAKSKEKLQRLLSKGENICIFPEGTWNLTSSKPMLPMYWGVIDLAQKNGVPIIPICLEYRDNICYVKFSDPMYVDANADKQIELSKLGDVFATLRWEMWEMFPCEKRCELEEGYWDRYVADRLAEYKKLDYEYERSCIRR